MRVFFIQFTFHFFFSKDKSVNSRLSISRLIDLPFCRLIVSLLVSKLGQIKFRGPLFERKGQ